MSGTSRIMTGYQLYIKKNYQKVFGENMEKNPNVTLSGKSLGKFNTLPKIQQSRFTMKTMGKKWREMSDAQKRKLNKEASGMKTKPVKMSKKAMQNKIEEQKKKLKQKKVKGGLIEQQGGCGDKSCNDPFAGRKIGGRKVAGKKDSKKIKVKKTEGRKAEGRKKVVKRKTRKHLPKEKI